MRSSMRLPAWTVAATRASTARIAAPGQRPGSTCAPAASFATASVARVAGGAGFGWTPRRFGGGGHGVDYPHALDRVVGVVQKFYKVTPEAVQETSSLQDLGLDSLDVVELLLMVEEEFACTVSDQDADGLHTVKAIAEWVSHNPHAK
jgi:NADH dehydrogenase (ubiquinone) 1 alpha/beta subcomplex 1